MSNKRITDLTELTTPTTDDVFPVVDIATNTTTKVQLGNLPTTTAVTTALATKQDTLVSGTNIKTVNSTSLLGSGNVAVQETLVSGTNIKTINSTSLLGSGDITISANPSGVAGAIQFSDGSAFASDAANLFWDDTNNRLGVGTNAPTKQLQITNSTVNAVMYADIGTNAGVYFGNLNNGETFITNNGLFNTAFTRSGNVGVGTGTFSNPSVSARLHVKGSGSTSATTSLLVQNSGGTGLLTLKDNGDCTLGASSDFGNISGTGCFFRFSLAVGTLSNATASAILQADSTTRGFLPPRMTTTQKNAIATPSSGLVVYDSTTNKLCCYNGSTWNDLF